MFTPRRLRIDRLLILIVAAAAAATVAATVLAAGLRLVRPGVLPGVAAGNLDVGGLSDADLTSALERLAQERAEERVRVVRPPAGGESRAVVSSRRAEMGYRLDIDATAENALARGRQTNPYAALWDHLLAFGGTTTVEVAESVDAGELSAWAEEAAGDLSVEPREGTLRVDGTDVETVYPAPGAVVDEGGLAERARAALVGGAREIEVEARDAAPRTDEEDVDEVAGLAERALSGPVTLTHGGAGVTFSPAEIGSMLAVRVTGDDLELFVRPRRLREAVTDEELAAVEQPPVDARFSLSGGTVQILPSEPGFALVPRKAARALLEAATGDGDRPGELPGDKVRAEFTTKDAKALDITEQVSTFTTYHACCEPRVANIHRIADLVDGTVVEPGDSFSLNGHVGPRTTENGFVGAPAIRDGEFVEEIGGGISQFATTMFNAIYFGGYDFLEYQPHSYYIDRYPMGREATISNPAPDLAFLNDSNAGIYVAASYTDTSITVTFYGNTPVEVESETGAPHNRKDPPEECRVNKDLERGEERVVAPGRSGFDVVVKRILVRGGNRTVEDFFTRYKTEPRIVERRRCPN